MPRTRRATALKPAVLHEAFIDIGIHIIMREQAVEWPTILDRSSMKNAFLNVLAMYRTLSRVKKNKRSDLKLLQNIFNDKCYQQGVDEAAKHLHRSHNFNNTNVAGAMIRFHWLVFREQCDEGDDDEAADEPANKKSRLYKKPILVGWLDPPEGGPVQLIFAPKLYWPAITEQEPQIHQCVVVDGNLYKKVSNETIQIETCTPSITRPIEHSNCSIDANIFIHQDILIKKKIELSQRFSSKIKSASMKDFIGELQIWPYCVTKELESKRITMLHALKDQVEEKVADTGRNSNFLWAEDEVGIESVLMRALVTACCSMKVLDHTTNLKLEDFELLKLKPAQQMENLPMRICTNKDCNDFGKLSPHYVRLYVIPEGLAVQVKGDKSMYRNLHKPLGEMGEFVKLAKGARYKQQLTMVSETHEEVGDGTGKHALCYERRLDSLKRFCDGEPTEWAVPLPDATHLKSRARIDLVIYTRESGSFEEVRKEFEKELSKVEGEKKEKKARVLEELMHEVEEFFTEDEEGNDDDEFEEEQSDTEDDDEAPDDEEDGAPEDKKDEDKALDTDKDEDTEDDEDNDDEDNDDDENTDDDKDEP